MPEHRIETAEEISGVYEEDAYINLYRGTTCQWRNYCKQRPSSSKARHEILHKGKIRR